MRKREHGIIPQGGVLISKVTGIPVAMGGALPATGAPKEDKWAGPLPKGWTDKSRSSAYDSFSQPGDVSKEGPTTNCMNKIDGHVDDPGAFCASLRDRATGTTKWRSGGKKK